MKEYIQPDNLDFKKNPPKILKRESTILNKEVYEYLEGLMNLEMSVLDKNNIQDEIIRQLTELNFFKKLVIYNIYNRVKNNISTDPKKHLLRNMHAFSVEYRDLERTDLLKFIYDEMMLNLYQQEPQNIEEKKEKRDIEITRLEKRIKNLIENEMLSNTQTYELSSTAKRLQVLKQLTNDEIKRQYEINKKECELQQQMLEQILTENNLTLSDFEEIEIHGGKKFLIKKYPHASIYIQK